MSNTIRSLATLPSRYSWKSRPRTRPACRWRDAGRVDRAGVGADAVERHRGPSSTSGPRRSNSRSGNARQISSRNAHVALPRMVSARPSRRRRCRRSSGRATGPVGLHAAAQRSESRAQLRRPSLAACADPTPSACPTAPRRRPRCARRPRRTTRAAGGRGARRGSTHARRRQRGDSREHEQGREPAGASLPVARSTAGASSPASRIRGGRLRRRRAGHLRLGVGAPAARPGPGTSSRSRVSVEPGAPPPQPSRPAGELVGQARGVLLDVGRQAVEAVAQLPGRCSGRG